MNMYRKLRLNSETNCTIPKFENKKATHLIKAMFLLNNSNQCTVFYLCHILLNRINLIRENYGNEI
jgi:hypothetical protein